MAMGTVGPVPAAAEWTVLRALRWPGRWFPSVVRVLAGPAGVFVIAAHPTTATVTLAEDRLRVGAHPDEQSLTDVTDAALVVAQHAGPYAAQVQPVLCFTSTPVTPQHVGGVLCCSVHDLIGWLAQRPAVLGVWEIDDVVTRLRMLMRAEVDCEPAADRGSEPTSPVAVAGLPAQPDGSRRRLPAEFKAVPAAVSSGVRWVFRGGLAARFAVLTVVTLAMLAYGPGALNPLGHALGRAFSDATTPSACPAAGPAPGTSSGLPAAQSPSEQSPSEQSPSQQSSSGEAQAGQTGSGAQVPPAQARAQWTPSGLTAAAVTHPICRGR